VEECFRSNSVWEKGRRISLKTHSLYRCTAPYNWKRDIIIHLLIGPLLSEGLTGKMDDSIFWFNDRKALQVQCSHTCELLYDDFWKKALTWEKDYQFPDTSKLLELKSTFPQHHWLPRYGSAVIFRKMNSVESSVTFVGLDGWKDLVHASESGRESTAAPDVRDPYVRGLGLVKTSKITEFYLSTTNR
jgi:hypothetical protein